MPDGGWSVLRIGEVEAVDVAGVHWRPLRRTLGVRAFGVNAYSANAGEHVVERHTEESLAHEEIYVVLSGHATFTLDEETVDAPPGSIVFVRDPSVRREAVAATDGTIVLAVGGKPGEPYVASAWETYFWVERYRATGEHAKAIEALDEALVEHPDHAGVIYSLACWHALAGHGDEALAHAQRAMELDERYVEWARKDDDLASIRDRLM
jgi:quercetin dioxygenase-like cupin family protein